jgi:hypothetical protein
VNPHVRCNYEHILYIKQNSRSHPLFNNVSQLIGIISDFWNSQPLLGRKTSSGRERMASRQRSKARCGAALVCYTVFSIAVAASSVCGSHKTPEHCLYTFGTWCRGKYLGATRAAQKHALLSCAEHLAAMKITSRNDACWLDKYTRPCSCLKHEIF